MPNYTLLDWIGDDKNATQQAIIALMGAYASLVGQGKKVTRRRLLYLAKQFSGKLDITMDQVRATLDKPLSELLIEE